jgi:hypothetical protein
LYNLGSRGLSATSGVFTTRGTLDLYDTPPACTAVAPTPHFTSRLRCSYHAGVLPLTKAETVLAFAVGFARVARTVGGTAVIIWAMRVPTLQASGSKVPSGPLGIHGPNIGDTRQPPPWSLLESWRKLGKLRPTGEKLHIQKRDAAISRSWYATWMAGRGW